MSNQIKTLVTEIANEEIAKIGGYASSYADTVEVVADRVADAVETKAKVIVEAVHDKYGYGTEAEQVLTEFGFIAEPEPEVEDEPVDDVTTEALDESRLSALEAFVEEIRPLVERAKAYLGV